MAPAVLIPALIAGMLLTGASNSLWSKWQDMQCVENCNDPNPRNHVLYEQPVWQTLQMFLGEMLCFLPVIYASIRTAVHARRAAPVHLPEASESDPSLAAKAGLPLRGWATLLLWLPAACDLTATTLMNVGLLYTPVSIYQMTRGGLVLFVALLSVFFLRRRLFLYQWTSLLIVLTGVAFVGLSGSLIKDALRDDTTLQAALASALRLPASVAAGIPEGDLPAPVPLPTPESTKILLGVFLILFAQIFTATQFVVEEKILSRYSVAPLVAVGLEGFFGTLSIVLLLPLTLYLFPPPTGAVAGEPSTVAGFFDLARGWDQLVNTPSVLWSGLVIMFSISMFNFFGLSVTRHVSATARSLTDTCRTLLIWIVSLGLGWERLIFPISLLQILGFVLLVYGTFLFNNLVRAPFAFLQAEPVAEPASAGADEEARGLLADEEREATLEETAALPSDLGRAGFDVVPPHASQASGASSGGVEALRSSEARGFDVAARAGSKKSD